MLTVRVEMEKQGIKFLSPTKVERLNYSKMWKDPLTCASPELLQQAAVLLLLMLCMQLL